MFFKHDPSKQAQEVIFTCKVKKVVHSPIFFNAKPLQQVSSQEQLILKLDISLMFDERIKAITSTISKTIDLLLKSSNGLPRPPSLQFINHSQDLI